MARRQEIWGWIAMLGMMFGALPASAESTDSHLDRLDQQLQMMQRQLYRNGNGETVNSGDSNSETGPATANLQVRIDQMGEELSQLRGQEEENKHQIEQLTRQQQLQQEDTQYRLEQLEQKAGGAPANGATPPVAGTAPPTSANPTTPATPPATTPSVTSAPEAAPHATPAESSGATADTPSDAKGLYNHAIGLMNKASYDDAAKSFTQFIQKFPKDPLIGNAYYWLGETYYVRADYANATKQFSQGFQASPNGSKAPDNLLKLGMSLAKLNKKKEACVVFKQIPVKYPKALDSVLGHAQHEAEQLHCP